MTSGWDRLSQAGAFAGGARGDGRWRGAAVWGWAAGAWGARWRARLVLRSTECMTDERSCAASTTTDEQQTSAARSPPRGERWLRSSVAAAGRTGTRESSGTWKAERPRVGAIARAQSTATSRRRKVPPLCSSIGSCRGV
eukprot:131460-Prymnesium_polylepis.2